MHIDKKLISKLEELAMLKLSDSEKSEVEKDLNEILAMVGKLQSFDIGDTKPLIHITEVLNKVRDDVAAGHMDRSKAMLNSLRNDGEFFIVPKVIK